MGLMGEIVAPAQTGGAETKSVAGTSGGREFLTFRLGDEQYGIDILKVQEIRGYERPTKIASAPAFLKGVINLRGVIVPIVDLRMKFDLGDVEYDALTVVIVLNVAQRVVGVVVDAVSDVVELAGEQIKPAPEFGAHVDSSFIIGIGSIRQGEQDRMLILTDIEKLLSGADLDLVAPAQQ